MKKFRINNIILLMGIIGILGMTMIHLLGLPFTIKIAETHCCLVTPIYVYIYI